RSVSQRTTPSPEPGSYDLITPCISTPLTGLRMEDHRNGAFQRPARQPSHRVPGDPAERPAVRGSMAPTRRRARPDAPRSPGRGDRWTMTSRRRDQLTGLVTLPAVMQPVHTWRRLGAPSTTARIFWMLGFHRRLVRRCEWLTFIPKDGCLPHPSHTAAIVGDLS